ncbi:MAG: hypothetical protein KCHDKBKB_02144 [Elusimicrobia bacterium]|nr:hypothetical protein [Elusimicrobiota bacterium]
MINKNSQAPKKSRFIGAVAIGMGLALMVAILLWRQKSFLSQNKVEALGLRGTSKVSRPLTSTQVDRLETHFLDIQAPPQRDAPAMNQTVNQVDDINRLNARQRP